MKIDLVRYDTNVCGYFYCILYIKSGKLEFSFKEYNATEIVTNPDPNRTVAQQLLIIKHTAPNFYKLICDMLKCNDRKIEDYENNDT